MKLTSLTLRYVDIVLIGLTAPLALLLGASPSGYAIGAAGWILLRGLGRTVERQAIATTELAHQLALRVGFRFLRVLLLVTATVFAVKDAGKSAGLAALLVITGAFTVQLVAFLGGRRTDVPRPPLSGAPPHADAASAAIPLADLRAQPKPAPQTSDAWSMEG